MTNKKPPIGEAFSLTKVSLEYAAALAGLEFVDRFLFDLAYTLAGEMQLIADLLQRLLGCTDTKELP